MNCCVIFCFKDGRENEAAIMKLYTIELSMLKQNHKTLDPSIFVVPIFLEQNILLKFYVGISVYMCIFLYLTMSYGKCLYLHNVDMTFRIIMLILSILWEK